MTQLSAEQIQANWNTFLAVIDTYITGDRSTLLKDLYLSMEEQTISRYLVNNDQTNDSIPRYNQ